MYDLESSSPVHERMGNLLFALQSLESALVNLFGISVSIYESHWVKPLRRLFIQPGASRTRENAEKLFAQFELPLPMVTRLLEVLEVRHWLVHDFHFTHGQDLMSEKDLSRMLAELNQRIDQVTELVNDINEVNIDRQLAAGLHDELVANRLKCALQTYRQTDIPENSW